jgi:hypothetical protein
LLLAQLSCIPSRCHKKEAQGKKMAWTTGFGIFFFFYIRNLELWAGSALFVAYE